MVKPTTETETPPDQKLDLSRMPDENDDKNAAAAITWWLDRIIKAKKFWEKDFKKMHEDSRFVEGWQWEDQTENDDRYVINLCQSEVAAAVSTLYAKNPTFKVSRKPQMDFAIWDENPDTLMNAQLAVSNATMQGLSAPPDAIALLNDVNQGKLRRTQIDRIAQTLQIVFDHQIAQQHPTFKSEMKQLIRREETHGVAYVKLDFQRTGDLSPEDTTKLSDITSRLALIERLSKDEENGTQREDYKREAEELRIAQETLRNTDTVITSEGLMFHFPRAHMLIPDATCTQLRGFVGARWLAEEFHLTRDQIMEVYKKEVGTKATAYHKETADSEGGWRVGAKKNQDDRDFDDIYRVFEVYNRENGSVFTVCEGFDEYLREPAPPRVMVERFFPYYTYIPDEQENATSIYPNSMVRRMRAPQREYNRSKEALRQHRIASKPHYVTADGVLDNEDQTNMEQAPAHAIIKLKALQPGQKADDLFSQVKKYPIDQNVYETSSVREDIQLVTRRSAARVGGVSKVTATADSIAEDSRQVEDRSKSDELDELLTELAEDGGIVLLMNMSKEEVTRIAGIGAMWPESDPELLIRDLRLEVEAGSSGRPNKALEVSTFQRLFPLLVQTPGIKPGWLAKKAVQLADSNIDLTEAYLEGLPSIMAMNAMAGGAQQPSTGNPENNPADQGAEGANKQPRGQRPDNQMTVSQGANEIPNTASIGAITQ